MHPLTLGNFTEGDLAPSRLFGHIIIELFLATEIQSHGLRIYVNGIYDP